MVTPIGRKVFDMFLAASISVGFGIWGDVGALMLAAFLIPAAGWFHRFWELEDEMQKMMFTITDPLFSF